MKLLKKACEEMNIKFFDKRDEEFAWIEFRYHAGDLIGHLGAATPKTKGDALVITLKNLIKSEQLSETERSFYLPYSRGDCMLRKILGIYMDENRKLFYAMGKKEAQEIKEAKKIVFGECKN